MLVGLALLLFRVRRSRRMGGAGLDEAGALYATVQRELARLNFTFEPGATPYELLQACSAGLEQRPRLHSAVEQVCTLYVRAAFSPRSPHPSELRAARTRWQQAWRERWQIRLAQFYTSIKTTHHGS